MNRLALAFFVLAGLAQAGAVRVERVPEGGVQPQVATAADGTLHLVYLKGPPSGCEVRYATKKPGDSDWRNPVTVNSSPHTAVAMGTIRGAQLAIGKDKSVHVVWNGPGAKDRPSALCYTRKEAGRADFSPQRDLRCDTKGLDGGASIAATARGEVFIVWHGARDGAEPGEENRVVFVLKSANNGVTFAAPGVANLDDAGVCACCSLKSFVSPDGDLFTLYRAARRMDQRDVTLLVSKDGGSTFQHRIVGPWAISACPMSSMSLTSNGDHVRGAWEADGQIFTSLLDGQGVAAAVSDGHARHPAVAVSAEGETVIAWSIGTGWQKGGDLAWVVLDSEGKPTTQRGHAGPIGVWDFAAAYADGDHFVVIY